MILFLLILVSAPDALSPKEEALKIVPPSALQTAAAIYPAGHSEHAKVIVQVTVDVDGDVTDVAVQDTAGADFDAAASLAVHKWKFTPATRGGVAISSRIKIPFVFEPPAQPSAAPPNPAGPPSAAPPSAAPASASAPTQQPSSAPVILAEPTSEPSKEEHPDEVSVRGAQRKVNRGGSDFEIQVGQLAVIASQKASDILQLAPGIFIANEGGSGHADQVFLRGFDAEQGQAIEFTVNGVPINEVDNTDGHGYADTHFIIPELVKSLRVIEGPFDPHQGDFAEAGSADYELGVVDRRLELSAQYGSFNSMRGLILWAPQGEREGTFAAVQAYKTDGFGRDRAGTNASMMAQYEGDLGARGLWRVLATAYGTHYQSAGVVRGDDIARIGYYGSEDPNQGGDAQRYTLSASLENPMGPGVATQQIFLTWRTLHIDEDFTGFLLDNQTRSQSYHPQRGDTIEQDYSAFTAGARGSYKLTGEVLKHPQSIEIGYYARYDHTTPQIDRLRYGTQIPYAVDEDMTTDVMNVAFYLDADLHPTRWLTLRGGVRQEYFDYNVVNQCATEGEFVQNAPLNQNCPTLDSTGVRLPSQHVTATALATEPKVTVLAQVAKPVTLTASFGQGAQSLDAAFLTQDQRAPFATVLAGEAGGLLHQRFAIFDLSARAVGYYTHVDHDLIFNPLSGRLAQATGTTRAGALLSGRLTGRWFDELISATYAHASYDSDGTLVPYVPSIIARSDTAVFGPLGHWRWREHAFIGSAGFAINFIGPRALPFSQTAASTLELDASVSLRWSYFKLGLLAENLTDAKYPLTEYFYASNFNSRPVPTLVPTEHFTAAPPFSLLATLSILFDAETAR